ncbi:MATE family efflux transporter [Mobilitalea sibirica]|uniref:Probable multidrug resistance protein NorM n=1 Tax=Mobilitalea sibirica TaxID=1462919 RepID=A0A8J7KSL9_9FIRM|nr:MATE family efflux transporter [Mobilitalea sibirica]MBH1940416.1 MATE family efflux transporter [Mobilitalea sibirica]
MILREHFIIHRKYKDNTVEKTEYKQNNLSQGNVVKQLFLFALPFIISNMIQTLYSVADMIIVGQFSGTVSMSGVNIGGQVTMLMTNLAVGLSAGATVLIAQSVGAQKTEKLKKVIGTLLTSLMILAVVMTVTMLMLYGPILRLIKTPGESFPEAGRYLTVTSFGTLFIFGYNALSAIMRGMGDSRSPLYFISIACATNVVLDLILVGIFSMGATGAGIATVFSQGISMLLCALYLIKRKFVFDFHIKSYRIDRTQLAMILKLGIPISFQYLISNFSFLVMTTLVNSISVTASAAVGAINKYNGFAILPAIAMNAAISTMCAQNLGANREDRAKKTFITGMIMSGIISYIIFVLTRMFPAQIISIFGNEEELIQAGLPYLDAFSIDYLLVPIAFSLNGLFIGAGHTTYSLFSNILAGIIVRAPMAYLLGDFFGFGLYGIGLAIPLATTSSIILNLWFYFSGRWRRKIIHFHKNEKEDGILEAEEKVAI